MDDKRNKYAAYKLPYEDPQLGYYLPLNAKLAWFREIYPNARIETTVPEKYDNTEDCFVCTTTIWRDCDESETEKPLVVVTARRKPSDVFHRTADEEPDTYNAVIGASLTKALDRLGLCYLNSEKDFKTTSLNEKPEGEAKTGPETHDGSKIVRDASPEKQPKEKSKNNPSDLFAPEKGKAKKNSTRSVKSDKATEMPSKTKEDLDKGKTKVPQQKRLLRGITDATPNDFKEFLTSDIAQEMNVADALNHRLTSNAVWEGYSIKEFIPQERRICGVMKFLICSPDTGEEDRKAGNIVFAALKRFVEGRD